MSTEPKNTEPKSIELEKEAGEYSFRTSTTQIPGPEAEHKRKIERITAWVFLFLLVVFSLSAGALVFHQAATASADVQRMAYGVIGAVLGVLWSHFGKLLETVARK
jgi:hypothetical protein